MSLLGNSLRLQCVARERLLAKGWDPHLPHFWDSMLGGGEGHRNRIDSCFYGNHRVCPRNSSQSWPHLTRKGRDLGKRNPFLQGEGL